MDLQAKNSKSNGIHGDSVKLTLKELAIFNKSNKSVEEYMRCFLESNILYIKNLNKNTNLLMDENNYPLYKKYIKKVGDLILENFIGKNIEKNLNKVLESKKIIIRMMEELSKDESLIKILSNLNEYNYDEMKILYLLTKTVINFALSGEPINLKTFIFLNINKIVDSIIENINPNLLKIECVVYTACKLLRLFFKNKPFLEKILSFKMFEKLYEYSNSEKFVVSSEIFKSLFYLITNKKIDEEIIKGFLEGNKANISNLFYITLVLSNDKKENYLLKRESLIFLNKLCENNKFYSFVEYFSNNLNNLKMVLIHMNDECLKIKLESVNLLYYFFVDIYNELIIKILLANKQNFYQFFQELEKESTDENSNLIEKRNFIYYELERLENLSN